MGWAFWVAHALILCHWRLGSSAYCTTQQIMKYSPDFQATATPKGAMCRILKTFPLTHWENDGTLMRMIIKNLFPKKGFKKSP